jgi:Sulfotransferase family
MSLTFVVGTGRCGSAFLSRMLALHPEVLSVPDLLITPGIHHYFDDLVDGDYFWRLLTAPIPLLDALIQDGVAPEGLTYPYGRGRFHPTEGIPTICHAALPALAADPDELYDLIAAQVGGRPVATVAAHLEDLLQWLGARLGGSVVVERTGGSLEFVGDLIRSFPDARFLLMHREVGSTAQALRSDVLARITEMGRILLPLVRSPDEVTPQLLDTMPQLARDCLAALVRPFTRERIDAVDLPLSAFAGRWLRATQGGLVALRALPADRWTVLQYETMMRHPTEAFRGLAEFLRVDARRDWLTAVSGSVRQRQICEPRSPAPAVVPASDDDLIFPPGIRP